MLSSLLVELYKFRSRNIRNFVRRLVYKTERGEMYSTTLRQIYRRYHDVDIGMYTHGGCFVPDMMARFTKIGRYCSIAHGVRTMNRNHPMDFKSTHAFFFNPVLGYCREDRIAFTPLEVGNDVWIGANALILPHVRQIGDGAVVAAGAVVNKDIPPYGVVVGNPARVVRFRFPKEVIEQLLASRWWEKDIGELNIAEFNKPFVTGPQPEQESVG